LADVRNALTVNGSRFQYGLFINAAITFLIIAAVVFFLVVRPYNAFRTRFQREGDDDVPPPEYAVETAPADALPDRLNDRAADGWRWCRWARRARAPSARCC
jgi:large-conductance mechanosensitive channel